jgi:hypothetical protein
MSGPDVTAAPFVADPSAFGPLVAASDIEDRLAATLQRWLASYLYEIERLHQITPGTLPQPRSWVRSSAIEKFPEDQLPAVIIGSPGLTDPPVADGAGHYTASWRVLLGVEVVAGPNRRALELARLYALALRGVALQQQQDPGVSGPDVVRIDWRDERYDQLDTIDDRTVCVGVVELAVQVAGVITRQAGPLDPLLPPETVPGPESPAWPTADTVDVDIVKQPLEES